MCYTVYIGTDKVLAYRPFIEGETYIHFERVEETDEVLKKFSKPNVYHACSYQGCSCGFAYDHELWKDNEEGADHRRSADELISFLKDTTRTEDIEYYCFETGDEYLPVETSRELDIRTIEVDSNYFDLADREFILFKGRSEIKKEH